MSVIRHISGKDWNSLDQIKGLSEHAHKELKRLKEQSIEVEAEFLNLFLKEIKESFLGDKNEKNALMGTASDFLGRELGKQLGKYTNHQIAKDIFSQESNKVVGVLKS